MVKRNEIKEGEMLIENATQMEGNKIDDSNYETNKDVFMTSNKENDDDRVETSNFGDVERKKTTDGSNRDENELGTNLKEVNLKLTLAVVMTMR